MKKKKSKLQKKKDDPKSKYWKSRADSLWGEIMHETHPWCAVDQDCAGNLEAHHLISRSNTATRHKLENGIILCSKHHKFCNKLSAHKAPLAFAEFLQENRPEQWEWCCNNKHIIAKPDYKQAYQDLLRTKASLNDVHFVDCYSDVAGTAAPEFIGCEIKAKEAL